jgi:hypothetical protein
MISNCTFGTANGFGQNVFQTPTFEQLKVTNVDFFGCQEILAGAAPGQVYGAFAYIIGGIPTSYPNFPNFPRYAVLRGYTESVLPDNPIPSASLNYSNFYACTVSSQEHGAIDEGD